MQHSSPYKQLKFACCALIKNWRIIISKKRYNALHSVFKETLEDGEVYIVDTTYLFEPEELLQLTNKDTHFKIDLINLTQNKGKSSGAIFEDLIQMLSYIEAGVSVIEKMESLLGLQILKLEHAFTENCWVIVLKNLCHEIKIIKKVARKEKPMTQLRRVYRYSKNIF